MPDPDEEILPRSGAAQAQPAGQFARHACPGCGGSHDFAQARFPDQDELERIVDSIDDADLQQQAEQLLEPLFDLVRKHPPDEALGLIAEAYPDMDDRQLQDLLARVLFVADTWGRLNA